MNLLDYMQQRLAITEALLSDVIAVLAKTAPQHAVELAFRVTAATRALDGVNQQMVNDFNLEVLHSMGADDKTPFQ